MLYRLSRHGNIHIKGPFFYSLLPSGCIAAWTSDGTDCLCSRGTPGVLFKSSRPLMKQSESGNNWNQLGGSRQALAASSLLCSIFPASPRGDPSGGAPGRRQSRRQLAPDSSAVRPPNRGQRRDPLTKDGYAGSLREDRVWGSPRGDLGEGRRGVVSVAHLLSGSIRGYRRRWPCEGRGSAGHCGAGGGKSGGTLLRSRMGAGGERVWLWWETELIFWAGWGASLLPRALDKTTGGDARTFRDLGITKWVSSPRWQGLPDRISALRASAGGQRPQDPEFNPGKGGPSMSSSVWRVRYQGPRVFGQWGVLHGSWDSRVPRLSTLHSACSAIKWRKRNCHQNIF